MKRSNLASAQPSSNPATASELLPILCYYTNPTKQLQIAKVSDAEGAILEHIVFSQQRLLFEALPDAQISIYTYLEKDGTTLLEEIPCAQLQVRPSETMSDTARETAIGSQETS